METRGAQLTQSKISLQDGWQSKINQDGRLYYLNHNTKTSHWLPPPTSWSDKADLPYGWEGAMDKNGKPYYINHITSTTTREDPFEIEDVPPVERDVVLARDSVLGFGFIAGSEKPVVIRSVTEGGPSIGKLLPGDKILKINGEDVSKKEGQFIIERIRQSQELIRLTVIQPYIDKTGLKSSFLSATKKQKLKAKPTRVRFAENESIATISPQNTKVPPSLVYLPNVLKVYLENGQTKSFKFDNKTTVKDVLHNIQEKLGIKCMEYFSLGVHDIRSPTNQQLTILQDDELVRQTAARPGSQHLKCLLRVTFVPKDAYDLLSRDPTAFDYFYLQCCNDVTTGRFGDELKDDMAIKLAALHIQQHVLCNKHKAKVSIKAVQKDDGLERFLPKCITEKYKSKELRKIIGQHIKQNQHLTAPGQKHLTELQAKLHYLKVISELKSFGSKFYSGTLFGESEGNFGTQMTVLVGPKCSVSQVINPSRSKATFSTLVNFSELSRLKLHRKGPICDDIYRLEMCRKENKSLVFLLHTEDAQDMATLINGYYRLFEDPNHSLLPDDETRTFLMNTEAPTYRGKHRVIAEGWNYPADLVSEIVATENLDTGGRLMQDGEHIVDLSSGPPAYVYDAAFISKLKDEKRFHSKENLDQTDGAQSFESESESESDSEVTPNRNFNNSFLDTSSDSSKKGGSLMDLNALTDLVDSMFNTTPERPTDETDTKSSSSKGAKKQSTEKKRFSFSGAVRPKRKISLRSMKYNASDSLATSNDDIHGSVKLVHYSSFHEDMLRNNAKQDSDSSDSDGHGDFIMDSVPRRKKTGNNIKAALKSRDSIYLIRSKVNYSGRYSPNPEQYSSDEDYDLDSSAQGMRDTTCNSPVKEALQDSIVNGAESDIIDLTVHPNDASVADIDISIDFDLNDVGLLEDGEDGLMLTERAQERDTSTSPEENVEDLKQEEEEELPVSMIDMPSPDSEESQELSDQAYGIQMAAIDALNASIAVDEAAANHDARPEPECESDSGNETISSETIENPIDQVGFSHSPTDYFHIHKTSPRRSSDDGGDNTTNDSRRSSDDGDNTTSDSTLDTSTLVGSLLDDSEDHHDPTTYDSAMQETKYTNNNNNDDNHVDSSFESVGNTTLNRLFKEDSPCGKTAISESVQNISVTSAADESVDEVSECVEEYTKQDDEVQITDQDLDELFALDSTQNVSIIPDMSDDELADVEDLNLSSREIEDQVDVTCDIDEINECDINENIEIKVAGEDQRQTPTSSLSVTHGSDSDSCTSTLRGSVSNLTSLESTEELSEDPSADFSMTDDNEGETNDAIDELIASLITAPPPLVSHVDEELLGTIIPPPPVDDFDFGSVDDVDVENLDEDQTDHEIVDIKDDAPVELTSHDSEEMPDCVIDGLAPEEPETVSVSIEATVTEPESPLTKYINSLKALTKENDGASQQNVSNHLDIKHDGVTRISPRKFRVSAGSVGESLDSGFHQSDSCDLDSLSSCFNSLQEGQFIKEKTVSGVECAKTEELDDGSYQEEPSAAASILNIEITKEDQEMCNKETKAIVEHNVESDTEQSTHVAMLKIDAEIPDVSNTAEITHSMSREGGCDVEPVCIEETKVNSDAVIRNQEAEAVELLDALTISLDNVSIASSLSIESISSTKSSESRSSIKDDRTIEKPKLMKPKPVVPPKPARPFMFNRRQSLDSRLGAVKLNSNEKKYPAPGPPPKMVDDSSSSVNKLESETMNLHRSESMQVYSSNDLADSHKPVIRSAMSISSRHPLVRSKAIDNSQTSTEDLQTTDDESTRNEQEKQRSPVKRSNTISVPPSEREAGVLYPARKAPPPPMPKPKLKNIRMGVSGTWSARSTTLPASANPPSIRKVLSPTRSKPWTRGPLPFARKDKEKEFNPEPDVKSPTKERKTSLPHKMFYTWTRKEASKAKHSLGRGDSPRGNKKVIDPPSLRAVSGLKRPSVLDLAERMQQASSANDSSPDSSKAVNRSISLRSPRTLPRTSVVYSPRHSGQITSPPAVHRTQSVDISSPSPREGPIQSHKERPQSMPCSPSHNHIELPKRPPPPRPRAPPRGSISSQPNTPPTPRAEEPRPIQRVNSFSGSISSDSSGTRTPPTPRAERRFDLGSPPMISSEEDLRDALSPIPLPSPVPPDDIDSSICSDVTSPPPLPTSAPPLPSSLPPGIPSTTPVEPSTTSSTAETEFVAQITNNQRHSPNLTLEIESKEYAGNKSILNAAADIDTILSELEESMVKLKPSTPSIAQFRQCKQLVLSEAREFTSNTKMFVSSAGQSAEQLVSCLNSSMHTLARLCSATQQFMRAIPSINQAKNLGNKIKEIASNFSITLQVAAEAHGKVLQDAKMQLLLRQAQTMAIMLSALMRTLRILHC
ncbi:uncharacterized protein [Amphiura filiformis]|uniref:uncharacterized protein n=1 Tax=Amphiura filiformis TaxID=82378 RepID=UPI003B222147